MAHKCTFLSKKVQEHFQVTPRNEVKNNIIVQGLWMVNETDAKGLHGGSDER
jgi:hypothetical protein